MDSSISLSGRKLISLLSCERTSERDESSLKKKRKKAARADREKETDDKSKGNAKDQDALIRPD